MMMIENITDIISVRSAAVEGEGRRYLSHVQGNHPGRHQDIQIIEASGGMLKDKVTSRVKCPL